ncbi:uncharacterized protein G2W53_013972 [Senna tora]|uniref:Uncharacterized protein n=1 Tax=Senna tora TaxID=362788 RepID=A0A834U0K5_9FABA|nr:uncharacterized protein G2W53_013972 [Senna tora]
MTTLPPLLQPNPHILCFFTIAVELPIWIWSQFFSFISNFFSFISGGDGSHGIIGEEFRFLGKEDVQADQKVGSIRSVRWWRHDGEEAG